MAERQSSSAPAGETGPGNLIDDQHYIAVCDVDELPNGEACRVEHEPPIAVFNSGGQYFAVDDTCTHGQSSLCEGSLENGEIECAWHFARFCLRTGEALTPPAYEPLRTYDVQLRGRTIFVSTRPRIG